ncbi:anthranilate phosphoribosyltransferase [Neobacillus mesonae]|nr:anthranilate phosphoribosyltransferase [Neobacillus mesonae]
MNMIHYLKEVGRGKRGSRDLTYIEAAECAEMILAQSATPAQIGAFLASERLKMESTDELKAFVDICRKYADRSFHHEGIDFAGPYDGRTHSFYASFATAFVVAAAGVKVTLHGSEPIPPKWGTTYSLLLRNLGINTDNLHSVNLLQAAKESGVRYAPAECYGGKLNELRTLREELGLRTIFNTAEKLIDYSHSPYLVFGIFHNTVFEKTAKVITDLNYRRAMIIQGSEGSEDLHIHRPTRTYLVDGGQTTLQVLDPEMYGIDSYVPELKWTAAKQAEVTLEVLQGKALMPFTNQVLFNAGVRLFIAEQAPSIEEGIYISKSLLESGAAWKTYQLFHDHMTSHPEPAKAVHE